MRSMRKEATEPERRLWSRLRDRQLDGVKFRRQMWPAGHIAYFYAASCKLVIEVDGDDHAVRDVQDQRRTERLEREGLQVLRFSNADVMNNMGGVLEMILMTVRPIPSPSQAFGFDPSLSLDGERGI
jgi:very-short-patch-repair endonuclease